MNAARERAPRGGGGYGGGGYGGGGGRGRWSSLWPGGGVEQAPPALSLSPTLPPAHPDALAASLATPAGYSACQPYDCPAGIGDKGQSEAWQWRRRLL